MAQVKIDQAHDLPVEDVRKRLEHLAKELDAKYGLTSRWRSESEARLEGSGTTGSVKIEPRLVRVVLDLSLAMTPMKGAMEKKIKDELHKLVS